MKHTKFADRLRHARLYVEVFAWRHGWYWLLLVLLFVSLALVQFIVLPRQRVLQLETYAQWTLLNRNLANQESEVGRKSPSLSDGDNLDQLLAIVYSEQQVSEVLRSVNQIAKRNAVQIDQSEFQTTATGYGGLRRIQVSLPINASYPRFKGFVKDVLRTHSGVSFDEVSLKRESVGQSDIEIRVKMSLWLSPATSAKVIP